MTEEHHHDHSEFMNDYLQYLYGGLLGFIILIVPALLPLEHLDIWLSIALALFAIAIPALALCLIMIFFQRFHPGGLPANWKARWKVFHLPALFTALGTGLIGIAFTFLHINLFIGLLFFASAACAGLILNYCANRNNH
jgi:hypothetical protein